MTERYKVINSWYVEFEEDCKDNFCFINAMDIFGVEEIFAIAHPKGIITHVYMRVY